MLPVVVGLLITADLLAGPAESFSDGSLRCALASFPGDRKTKLGAAAGE